MPIIISLLILSIYLFLIRKRITKTYLAWSYLLTFYLTVALYEIVGFPNLQEWQRLSSVGESIFNPVINWIPFSQGVDLSSILNIVFFIPLGVALPVMWQGFNRATPTLIYGFLFSALIEFSQLFTLHRQSDINDFMMNTTGVLIGWCLHHYFFKWSAKSLDTTHDFDWLVYPTISILSCFFF